MPKSTGPLLDQLTGASQASSTPNMTDSTTSAADKLGANKGTNAIPNELQLSFTVLNSKQNPSIISSAGAIGKQFNPDGAIGSIGQAVGGPFSKDGVIGSQFDASKDGIAGHVERAVDGPSNPAGSGKKA
ncbi:hypothetical protein ST47_g1445 [Ascochyta rabiei]|uniref:Uncharacterized protein n=1 Tax=Didymella rabiei TaxID=5454 RepID=A0A163L0J8_DIDRA|nr:hypothetical protein ST47_g1445 [Ascochyta rabiei]